MRKPKEPLSAQVPELSGPRLTRRLILFILALAVAVGAFTFGVRGLLSADPGWTVIEADGSVGLSCADDFILRVELGAGGHDPGADRRAAISAYTKAAARAWQLFTPDSAVQETVNIWWLNTHPNMEIPVEPALYRALSDVLACGRHLYLGPLYENAAALFASQSDSEARLCDPRLDPEIAAFTAEALRYLSDPAHVTLDLLGDSRVCLRVSPEYLAFAADQGTRRYIDFSWMRDAFAADMIADALTQAGLVSFQLTSRGGWSRFAGPDAAHTVHAMDGGKLRVLGEARIPSPAAVAYLTAFPLSRAGSAYTYADGTVRTAFLSPSDGLDHPTANALLLQSADTCAGLLTAALKVWIPDEIPPGFNLTDELDRLSRHGISSLVCRGADVRLSPDAAFVFRASE